MRRGIRRGIRPVTDGVWPGTDQLRSDFGQLRPDVCGVGPRFDHVRVTSTHKLASDVAQPAITAKFGRLGRSRPSFGRSRCLADIGGCRPQKCPRTGSPIVGACRARWVAVCRGLRSGLICAQCCRVQICLRSARSRPNLAPVQIRPNFGRRRPKSGRSRCRASSTKSGPVLSTVGPC